MSRKEIKPMADLNSLLKANMRSHRILEQSLARLARLRVGAPLSQRAAINAQIANVQAELTQLDTIDAHLGAASVEIQPMSAADADQLDQLSAKLDNAILHSATINATIDTIADLIDTVQQVASIISSHTSA